MKKSSIMMMFLIVAFDYLFYKQTPGINLGVFSMILIITCLIWDNGLLKNRFWILICLTTLIASVFVGIYGDILSVFAYLISGSLLAAYSAGKNSSIVVAISGCLITYLKSPFILFGLIKNQLQNIESNEKNDRLLKAGVIGLIFFIVVIFFFIYRNSSLLFYKLTQEISLEFLSFSLFLFTLNGLLLLLTFKKYSPINELYKILDKPSRNLDYEIPEKNKRNTLEQFAGIMLLCSLNVLLLVVNILDINYLINRHLPSGVSYSEFIHQGVEMLIVSIILAISIILFFFRGVLNFSDNKWLNILGYLWIAQNIFMVISNASRNSMYIDAYGLTEKRIGVYFYLLLAALGLITTFIKIYKKQTNVYLIRSTSVVFFIILLFSCPINWDNIITSHDLKRSDARANFDYLSRLSYTNIPQLLDYINMEKSISKNADLLDQQEKVHEKIMNFYNTYYEHPDWQSKNYKQEKIFRELSKRNIHQVFVQSINYKQFSTITFLPNLNELTIRNSNLFITDKWPDLKNIKRLSVTNCEINDIEFLEPSYQLEYLDISRNNIRNFRPLYRLKHLKELHLSGISKENLKILQIMLPKTKIIIE